MKNLLVAIILIFNFSCKKEILVNPDSIKEAKECSKYIKDLNGCSMAFIKEFVGDNSIISIENNKYLIKEVYMTHMVDHDTVYKHATSLLFKTFDLKRKTFGCPEDYTKFEIIADKISYTLGNNSDKLVSYIPITTSYFQLVYYDNKEKKVINFKEKLN